MIRLNSINSKACYMEIGQEWFQAFNGENTLELPLDRLPNGRLTAECKERLKSSLQAFLNRKPWHLRQQAVCAIGARGVSLRRMVLPSASRENLKRLLLLQIEAEFPISPDELSWGFCELSPAQPDKAKGQGNETEVLVVAVKRDVLEEYQDILNACATIPVFTLAGFARNTLCPQKTGSYAMLDIGQKQSELFSFVHGTPSVVRILPWGDHQIVTALEKKLKISGEEARNYWMKGKAAPTAEWERHIQDAAGEAADALAACMNGHLSGVRLYLSGTGSRSKALSGQLSSRLTHASGCESLASETDDKVTAAIRGLQKVYEADGKLPLILHLQPSKDQENQDATQSYRKWVIMAASILAVSLSLPYLEALLLKPVLARRLAAIQADKDRMPLIDRELNFLQYLKQNQPPYLDAAYVIAKAAPQGARVESLAMSRRGDVSLRGSMRDSQQVADFRTKLFESGFFSSVTVEEQTPTPDRQKVLVRISAQWKDAGMRQTLSIGPTQQEIDKLKPVVKDASTNAAKPGATPQATNAALPSIPGAKPSDAIQPTLNKTR